MLSARDEPAGKSLPSRSDRTEWVLLALVALSCGWLYFWSALQYPNSCFSREPGGYYGLLTAGFRSGHLYAAIEPHPALLALKDPYDPVANAPYRVHDMTLWRGKYYLYFGVTPVLILFWPVVAMTGYYPTEAFAVALFAYGGFCAALALLIAVRRRHYPQAPSWVVVAGALCLGFANPVQLLTQGPQFYQVPISCAYCLHLLMLGALYRALHARRRTWLWLAGASLLFGLSVGARPNYVLGGFVLCVPLVWLFFVRRPREIFLSWRAAGLIAATFGPAVACGCGLLFYNWQRFGSPLEFGMHYQLAGVKVVTLQPMAWGNFLPHFREYLFNSGTWSPYFPFFTPPSGVALGMLKYNPWLWLAPLAFIPWRREAGAGNEEGRTVLPVILFLAFGINLSLLSFFFGTTTERYPSDFTPAWLLLGGIGALALTAATGKSPARRWARVAVLGGAACSLFIGLATFAKVPDQDGKLLVLARAANGPAYAWQRAQGQDYGALRLELELPQGHVGATEPLFQTGRSPSERDWLQLEYLADDRARIGFFHAGMGLLEGGEFAVPPSRRIVVETRCGSLLPPFGHPVFAGWTHDIYETVHRDLDVKVDGKQVLRTMLECYPSPPQDLRIGELGWPSGGIANRFSGRVLGVRRMSPVWDDLPPPALQQRTPVELTLLFLNGQAGNSEPLLVTGTGTHSDLLYCSYEGPDRIKFALDHYGNGGPQSEALAYDPLQPHQLKVWLGSLADRETEKNTPPWERRLVVIFDGHVVLNSEQVFYPATPASAVVGFNPYASSTARRQFTGRVLSLAPLGFGALPSLSFQGEYGAVEMTVVFPLHVLGVADPLVVTGLTGKGDLVYVRYLDPRHASFGFDHWGVGGFSSPPVELDYGPAHRLEITMGSLYPPGAAPAWRNRVRVRLDGRTVLEGEMPCHPSTREQIRLLENLIGGSTCGPIFNGRVVSVERLPEPRP